MRIEEFRKLVKAQFGEGLKHATPANVREFMDSIDQASMVERFADRIVLNERCTTYEEVIKDFFAQVLELPTEEALIALWTLAFDLAFNTIESQYSERFASLFKEGD